MKSPKTIDGKLNAIRKAAGEREFAVRGIWLCNAGYGILYIKYDAEDPNATIVHTYYNSIEGCINGEYRRLVLKTKERGGMCL